MFRKLSKSELEQRGFSPKSERYIDTSTDTTISKRQFQKQQRGVTYTQFRKEIAAGTRTYAPRKVTPLTASKVTKTKYRGTSRLYSGLTPQQVKKKIRTIKSFDKTVSISVDVPDEFDEEQRKKYEVKGGVSRRYFMSDYSRDAALESFDESAMEFASDFDAFPEDFRYNVLIRDREKRGAR